MLRVGTTLQENYEELPSTKEKTEITLEDVKRRHSFPKLNKVLSLWTSNQLERFYAGIEKYGRHAVFGKEILYFLT